MNKILIFLISCFLQAQPGILKVGFDIDDTVLFSEPVFLKFIEQFGEELDYSWINANDKNYSVPIKPTIDLIHFFHDTGHDVVFITARPADNGYQLAEYLSAILGFKVAVNFNLFFMPNERIDGQKYTTKHHKIRELGLDLFYGDSDTDIIAALKAGVHPVRVVRSKQSLESYTSDYFGDTGDSKPFTSNDLNIFYTRSVGVFGESIYPIFWEGPISE